MGKELKPCPFCGTDDKLKEFAVPNTNGNRRFIRCIGCGAEGPWSYQPLSASGQWNRRSLDAGWVSGWQPIETAPKDGQIILMGWGAPDHSLVFAGRYVFADLNTPDGKGWIAWSDIMGEMHVERMTHWMPLPAAPSASPQPPVTSAKP